MPRAILLVLCLAVSCLGARISTQCQVEYNVPSPTPDEPFSSIPGAVRTAGGDSCSAAGTPDDWATVSVWEDAGDGDGNIGIAGQVDYSTVWFGSAWATVTADFSLRANGSGVGTLSALWTTESTVFGSTPRAWARAEADPSLVDSGPLAWTVDLSKPMNVRFIIDAGHSLANRGSLQDSVSFGLHLSLFDATGNRLWMTENSGPSHAPEPGTWIAGAALALLPLLSHRFRRIKENRCNSNQPC